MNVEKVVSHVIKNDIDTRPIKINNTDKKYSSLTSNKDNGIFDLKKNFFDPTKGSPPSNWTVRLIDRIQKL